MSEKMGSGKLQRFRTAPHGPGNEDSERRDARVAATPDADFGEQWWFWCSACVTHHAYITKLAKDEKAPLWRFVNGDVERPTFRESLLYRTRRDRDGATNPDGTYPNPVDWVCHLYVTDGKIEYQNDCTHALRGKTVPLSKLD